MSKTIAELLSTTYVRQVQIDGLNPTELSKLIDKANQETVDSNSLKFGVMNTTHYENHGREVEIVKVPVLTYLVPKHSERAVADAREAFDRLYRDIAMQSSEINAAIRAVEVARSKMDHLNICMRDARRILDSNGIKYRDPDGLSDQPYSMT